MTLRIGIIGLPNVGKSTTFNALTRTQNAQVANYPFCTIHPNRAIVPVPDPRLDELAALVGVPNRIPATIEFVDIAGLVRGAHRGEGLGNQFLAQIRNVDAILHVVRCFEDPNVVHVSGEVDPESDIETIQIELALADLEQLDRKIEKLETQAKADKKVRPLLAVARHLHDFLSTGKPAINFPPDEEGYSGDLIRELRLLTANPVILAANVDEAGLADDPGGCVEKVRRIAAAQGHKIVVLSAQLEMETIDLNAAERAEFLALAGVDESGLDALIRESFATLGLISFFTKNESEVRAWTVPAGTTAPQAAGRIHTDFERGFIRAEVVPFEVFHAYGSDAAVRSAGALKIEGRDYIVQDGDIILFRFNV